MTPASTLCIHSYHVPGPMPLTPSSSSSTPLQSMASMSNTSYKAPTVPSFTFTWVVEDGMRYQQATPQTNPQTTTTTFDAAIESPSTQSCMCQRPKMKVYTPNQPSSPSASL
ncbi:hypothetical protein RSAG8_11449, partial [Rhizoctonia solani AG-8 WAC10335]